jgi:hypothetical protein
MTERRYDEDEAAAIFRAATEGTDLPAVREPSDGGLTLDQLQAIGREVGLSPESVAIAAATLEVRAVAPPSRMLGLPTGVSRSIELGRRLSDEEWERLVVRLREVFAARGRTRSEGTLRQWTNGNLQVLLEPTATGHRLRMTTRNDNLRSAVGTGLAFLGVAGASALWAATAGTLGTLANVIAPLGVVGAGFLGLGAFRLPRWARRRATQMEAIAAEVAASARHGDR